MLINKKKNKDNNNSHTGPVSNSKETDIASQKNLNERFVNKSIWGKEKYK